MEVGDILQPPGNFVTAVIRVPTISKFIAALGAGKKNFHCLITVRGNDERENQHSVCLVRSVYKFPDLIDEWSVIVLHYTRRSSFIVSVTLFCDTYWSVRVTRLLTVI